MRHILNCRSRDWDLDTKTSINTGLRYRYFVELFVMYAFTSNTSKLHKLFFFRIVHLLKFSFFCIVVSSLELVTIIYSSAGMETNDRLSSIFSFFSFSVVEMSKFFLNKMLTIVVNVVRIFSIISKVSWEII